MSHISQYLSAEHYHCDSLFAETENAVAESRWEQATSLYDQFHRETEQHFQREEEVLFPAFEQTTGVAAGPTEVMRGEHRQMRRLFSRLDLALASHNAEQFLGEAETLLTLMQQHNLKEENVLYRLASQALASEAQSLIDKMQSLETSSLWQKT
ncbi:MAG: hemerythrin domain-containing protein [Betaproteobacteria bacterium]|nr:hemerythrin domain-containing protein [Betaproteobacteria bacterium]MDE2623250.1 hemerythrin domain-containing protein [Betaproteobacteria bacterium]